MRPCWPSRARISAAAANRWRVAAIDPDTNRLATDRLTTKARAVFQPTIRLNYDVAKPDLLIPGGPRGRPECGERVVQATVQRIRPLPGVTDQQRIVICSACRVNCSETVFPQIAPISLFHNISGRSAEPKLRPSDVVGGGVGKLSRQKLRR